MNGNKFVGAVRLVGGKAFLRIMLDVETLRSLPIRRIPNGNAYVDLEVPVKDILSVLDKSEPAAALFHHYPVPEKDRCDECQFPRAFTTFEGRKLCLKHYLEAYPVEEVTDAINEAAVLPPAVVV